MNSDARPAASQVEPAHLGLLLLINLAWGYNVVAGKYGVGQFPPILFCLLRFGAMALLLLPFLRVKRGQMRWLLAAAVTGGGLQFAVMFVGLALSGSAAAVAIAGQLGVPFATLLSVAVLGERIRWRRVAGIALSFAGVVVLGFDPEVLDSLPGLGLAVLAALLGALGLVAIKRTHGVQPLELQAWFAWVSVPLLLPATLLLEHGQWHSIASAGPLAWGALAYTAIGSSLLAHTGFFWLLQRYPVTSVAPLTVLAPLFAVGFAVLLLGERPDWRLFAGGAMTLAGVVIIVMRERRLVDTGT